MLSFWELPPPEAPLEEESVLFAPALPEPAEPPLDASSPGVGTPLAGEPPPMVGVPIVEWALPEAPPLWPELWPAPL